MPVLHLIIYHIFSNKRSRRLSKALKCGAYWRATLKKGRRLFQSLGNIYMKFKKLVIFSFQITINDSQHDIEPYTFQNC